MFVKELEITLENGMKISGELDLPERQGQWKTIILFHGSGPSDRHATVESMGGIVSRNFDLLSEGFVKARYAVFRYDKRENYDIEIIIRDAREVTRFVSGLSEVEGILFYGWSEGVRAKLGNVAESYTTSMAGGGNRVISGIIGMVPVTFIVNTNVDRNDIDHPLHLYHRIELTFSTGRLCLVNTHGPVIWLPFLHMPRDEYGTLSINVEEEVNIPSGVTIGNVMLPSVKETFEQIWPDAVKKALEILFKQNRTEKMSMAQYQIYVSKLWSEICQKVGYMNIVDYDNFGDIKSIFYDLEKRHLIKKENDGIE